METVLAALGAGVLLGVSLAAPPGPIIAIMAHESVRRGFPAGLRVGLGAMTSDAVYLLLTWLGATKIFAGQPRALGTVGLGGALLMTYFAWTAWRSTRRNAEGSTPRAATGFTAAFLLGLTNPYQIAWWLSSGLPLIHILGTAVVVGFFVGILIVVIAYAGMFTHAARRARSMLRWVGFGSALVLAGFAAYLAWSSYGLLTGA